MCTGTAACAPSAAGNGSSTWVLGSWSTCTERCGGGFVNRTLRHAARTSSDFLTSRWLRRAERPLCHRVAESEQLCRRNCCMSDQYSDAQSALQLCRVDGSTGV